MSLKNLILKGPSTGNRLRVMREVRKMNNDSDLPITKAGRVIHFLDSIAILLWVIGFIGIGLYAFHVPGFHEEKTFLISFGIFLLGPVLALITLPIQSSQDKKIPTGNQ